MSDMQEKDKQLSAPVPDTEDNSEISLENISFFKENQRLLFVFKKSQKLAAAIYLVTDFVSEEEKIRRDLRELSLLLVKDILAAASFHHSSLPPTRVLEILSLLEIASAARLISSMNAEILKREYRQILQVITEAGAETPPASVALSKELLHTDTPRPPRELPRRIPNLTEASAIHTAPHSLQKKEEHIGQNKGQETVIKNERSSSILDLLKKTSRALSIKDISVHIRGVGEKTIQRELSALVAAGVLKREGERRWSRYSLR